MRDERSQSPMVSRDYIALKVAVLRMRGSTLTAAWTAWRQYAAYSGSAKRMLCIAVARLQNSMLSKAWQSWHSYIVYNKDLKQRLTPILGSKLRGIKWAATQFWAEWAHRKASLRVLLLQAQQARLLRIQKGCFAAWFFKVQRKTGAPLASKSCSLSLASILSSKMSTRSAFLSVLLQQTQ